MTHDSIENLTLDLKIVQALVHFMFTVNKHAAGCTTLPPSIHPDEPGGRAAVPRAPASPTTTPTPTPTPSVAQ